MKSGNSNTILRQAGDELPAVEIDASERLERRQLEMLLTHALKISGGDFSYIVSPAGKGAYAEQFVQLDAGAIRMASGQFSAADSPLNSRRADPSTQSVMRFRKIVQGSVLKHGLPLHFTNTQYVVTHFVQIPIVSDSLRTSVLLVANPGISIAGKLQGDIQNRLLELADVIAKRQRRNLATSRLKNSSSLSSESAFHLRRLKEELNQAVVTVNTAGVIRGINPAAEKLLGVQPGRALGMTFDRYLAPKYFISTLHRVESWKSGHSENSMFALNHRRVSILDESGESKQLNAAAYYLQDDKERAVTFVLSEPKSEMAQKDASHSVNILENSMPLGVIRLDANCQCEYANELWCQISGQSSSEAKGLGWTDVIHFEDLLGVWLALGNAVEKSRPHTGKLRLSRLDGTVRQIALAISYVPDEVGRADGFIIVFQDLTGDYLAQQHIDYVAGHDAMTGLANRSLFLDSLQVRLNNRHLRSKTALLYVNVKSIKAINSGVGQHAGDEILRQVSKRLMSTVEKNALGARISGSEFAIIMRQTIDPIEVCSTAARIVRCIDEPYSVFGDVLHLSATVGIVLGNNDSNSSDQMLKQADVALSAATLSEHSDWKVYTRLLDCKPAEYSQLSERLREAVSNQEFTLDYQPQYSLEKDEIASFEAFLRWVPGDIRVPSTEQLNQVLEDCNLIAEVGSWMLETACRQFMTWKEIGLIANGCTMSVSVAHVQLMNLDFPKQIATILSDCQMSAGQLNLEIAESDLGENDTVAFSVVDELKRMGLQLSLSGFGTGKTSLSHLNRLPIDFLKIDRSFVMAMNTHHPSRSLVMSVLAMANTLDIDVVAEGIESNDTLGELRAAHCKLVQGDLISEAKSAAFLEPMLVRRNYKSEDMLELS